MLDRMRAEAVVRHNMPGWEIYHDDEHIADVWPLVLGPLTRTHGAWAESREHGIGIWPVTDMDSFIEAMTETRTFDWAVPLGIDGRYPHDGAAITIYDSVILPHGVVSLAHVRYTIMAAARLLIARACGLGSLVVFP
jgi:hypothetical protein